MVKKLRMAGYRGQSPVVTFIAIQVIIPGMIFIAAALFTFVVPSTTDYPFFAKLSAVVAATLISCYVPGLYVKIKSINRQTAVRRAWPDALDLLLICVKSGMGTRKRAGELATKSQRNVRNWRKSLL